MVIQKAKKNKRVGPSEGFLDDLDDHGVLSIASRFKRLYELCLNQSQAYYNDRDTDFKAVWFSTMHAIYKYGPISMNHLAEIMRVTVSNVSQVTKDLVKAGYAEVSTSLIDPRHKKVILSEKGQSVLNDLVPCIKTFESDLNEILGDKSEELLITLDQFENKLNDKPLLNTELPSLSTINIETFANKYEKSFRSLNKAWISKQFQSKPADFKHLEKPEQSIIAKGGEIFLMIYQEEVIGTAAILKRDKHTAELVKMAVTPAYLGLGLGQQLMEHCLLYAQEKGYSRVYLEVNSRQRSAVALYKRNGFKAIESREKRSDKSGRLCMQKDL